jgi:hypothetical protein
LVFRRVQSRMKCLYFLIVVILVSFVQCRRFSDEAAVTAIAKIVEDVYYERSITFDIITYRNSLEKLVNKVAKSMQKSTAIKNIKDSYGSIAINQSAILFFDTMKLFHQFYKRAFSCLHWQFETHKMVYSL